jgi:3-oxoacyl-[acyl-carrier protein] reductase
MADRYQMWTNGAFGGLVAKRFGLPRPEPLRRYAPGGPLVDGPVLVGGTPGLPPGSLVALLDNAADSRIDVREAIADHTGTYGSDTPGPGALVYDATGIESTADLAALYEFFHPRVRTLRPCGRVVIIGSARPGAAQRAIDGFMRSLAKELRRGATANLIRVAPSLDPAELGGALAFFLSARSAYISGQVLPMTPSGGPEDAAAGASGTPDTRFARTAVVTGSARGIGAVIAETLAREGLSVVCVDVPGQAEQLSEVAKRVGGEALPLDITTPEAPDVFAGLGGIDVFVHNAGVLRDKTLARMDRSQWDTVLAVNLQAVETITARLIAPTDPLLRPGGRIVCTSSVAGIAGNVGQTNYASSKAGLIGLVEELAPTLAERFGGTINAVAPGFIETQMTASIPLFIREAGRRLNSLRQGGQPIDVAEAVSFLAEPGSGGINGRTLRVCGQSLLGA